MKLKLLKTFIEAQRKLETEAGVKSENLSRLDECEGATKLLLCFNDAATTVQESEQIVSKLMIETHHVCYLNHPGHGTEQDADLNQFTAQATFEKVKACFNAAVNAKPDGICLLGISTGAQLAMYLCGRKNNALIESIMLINPYLAGYFGNDALVATRKVLKALNVGNVMDNLVLFGSGHQVQLDNQTFKFISTQEGNEIIPMEVLIQEQIMLEKLKNLQSSHPEKLPENLKVSAVINYADLYIHGINSKQFLKSFYKDCQVDILGVRYPKEHTITAHIADNEEYIQHLQKALASNEEIHPHVQEYGEIPSSTCEIL